MTSVLVFWLLAATPEAPPKLEPAPAFSIAGRIALQASLGVVATVAVDALLIAVSLALGAPWFVPMVLGVTVGSAVAGLTVWKVGGLTGGDGRFDATLAGAGVGGVAAVATGFASLGFGMLLDPRLQGVDGLGILLIGSLVGGVVWPVLGSIIGFHVSHSTVAVAPIPGGVTLSVRAAF